MNSASPRSREEPIRLFRSDFLEFFSHISPAVVLAVWGPVFLYFLGAAVLVDGPQHGYLFIPIGLLLGWFAWTFFEYILHRFVFHYHPKTERFKRMFFVMHGVHHAQPMCRTRLVMPPALSIPLSVFFYAGLHLLVVELLAVPHWFNPLFAGMVAGYLVYDLTHYMIHHSRSTEGFFFELRKHHLKHHGRCDFMRFGVSTTIWDRVFGTLPAGDCPKPRPGENVPGRPVKSIPERKPTE